MKNNKWEQGWKTHGKLHLFFLSKLIHTTLEPVNQKVTTVYAPDILSKGFIIAQKQAQSW